MANRPPVMPKPSVVKPSTEVNMRRTDRVELSGTVMEIVNSLNQHQQRIRNEPPPPAGVGPRTPPSIRLGKTGHGPPPMMPKPDSVKQSGASNLVSQRVRKFEPGQQARDLTQHPNGTVCLDPTPEESPSLGLEDSIKKSSFRSTSSSESEQEEPTLVEEVDEGEKEYVEEEPEPGKPKKSPPQYPAEEILSTEITYVKQLKILHTMYEKARASDATSENHTTMTAIFRDIGSLVTVHENLAEDLKKVHEDGEYLKTPSVFLRTSNKYLLKIYKSFLGQYENNRNQLYSLIQRDKNFRDICAEVQKSSEFILQDCPGLYQAVYARLNRYVMTFKEFQKRLSSCEDEGVDIARRDVVELIEFLDQLIHKSEHNIDETKEFRETYNVYYQIEGNKRDMLVNTRFIKRGPAQKVARRSQGRILERHLFLFSNCFFICEPQSVSGKYRTKLEMTLFSMKLEEIEEEDASKPYSFRIKATQDCMDISFTSEEEKMAWWDAIEEAIKKERATLIGPKDPAFQLGKTAPTWVKDEETIMCMLCATLFTVLNRRHHCRGCGKLVCKKCSKYEDHLEYCGSKVRVCQLCHVILNGEDGEQKGTSKKREDDRKGIHSGKLNYQEMKSDGQWSAMQSVFCVLGADTAMQVYAKRQDIKQITTIVTISFNSVNAADLPDLFDDNCGFLLAHTSNPRIGYYFQATTVESKEKWLEKLRSFDFS